MYIDVSESFYGYTAIQFVSKVGLMSGDPDGNFYPDAPVSWAELCQIVTFFLENGAVETDYPDVNLFEWEDHWACQYVSYCIGNGLIEPETVHQIHLDEPIKMNEAHSIFVKTREQKKLLTIPDLRKQNPNGFASRTDIAHLIYRICDLTGRAIAESVFRLNKRNRWGQSLRLLQRYALCVEFVDSDISLIFNLICDNQAGDEGADVLCYEHMAKIFKRKSLFRKHKTREELYHYTGISSLEKLTQKKAKFRLSNVAYLNDPLEGRLFNERMKACFQGGNFDQWDFLSKARDEFVISDSYVVSFTDQDMEQLPMWVQYGDGAKGCRIGIHASSIKVPLYSIVYDANTVNQFLSSVKSVLQSYVDRKGGVNMNDDIVFIYATKVLTQVSYLHKDKHYEQEREIRILLFADPSSAKVDHRIRENEFFPRLFIELEDEVSISSIVLGPRATGGEKIAVALAGRGLDPQIIRKSEIHYR